MTKLGVRVASGSRLGGAWRRPATPTNSAQQGFACRGAKIRSFDVGFQLETALVPLDTSPARDHWKVLQLGPLQQGEVPDDILSETRVLALRLTGRSLFGRLRVITAPRESESDSDWNEGGSLSGLKLGKLAFNFRPRTHLESAADCLCQPWRAPIRRSRSWHKRSSTFLFGACSPRTRSRPYLSTPNPYLPPSRRSQTPRQSSRYDPEYASRRACAEHCLAQAEIHAINEETADDVRAWQANAQSVQDDILRSKALAAEIIKASETPAVSGSTVDEIEAKADFLIRELNYNAQVVETLKGIKSVNETLDEVEQARDERRILDALHLLESEQCVQEPGWALLTSH
ncbi:hypothetical protein L209DRAFT_31030 [Thermothelomyces heterothallicus CBS 203.75]